MCPTLNLFYLWQCPRLSFRKIAYVVLGFYLLVTSYTTFRLLNRKLQAEIKDKKLLQRIKSLAEITDDTDWNPWGEEFESELQPQRYHVAPALWEANAQSVDSVQQLPMPVGNRSPLGGQDSNSSEGRYVIEIWSKAAIGLYFWEHILQGLLESRMGGVWSFGERSIGAITFRFRTGPGVVPNKAPQDTENLLLVLNGREPSKVEVSKMWLDYLPLLPRLQNVAVVLLGNERCDNEWIHPYMSVHGGLVKCVLLVYDSPDVDNINFFQWPLGVATYRDFPHVDPAKLSISDKRMYIFNFMGTVYKNSSREILLSTVNGSAYKYQAYIKPRLEWLPNETTETRDEYIRILSNSDLTLNPVGINTECYRIYESLSLGSVPVVEDIMTPGLCGDSPRHEFFNKNKHPQEVTDQQNEQQIINQNYFAPLRLLKKFKAPVIFIKNWKTDLEAVLKKESQMSHYDRVKRRKHVLQWYEGFKSVMKDELVSILLDKFFHIKNR